MLRSRLFEVLLSRRLFIGRGRQNKASVPDLDFGEEAPDMGHDSLWPVSSPGRLNCRFRAGSKVSHPWVFGRSGPRSFWASENISFASCSETRGSFFGCSGRPGSIFERISEFLRSLPVDRKARQSVDSKTYSLFDRKAQVPGDPKGSLPVSREALKMRSQDPARLHRKEDSLGH